MDDILKLLRAHEAALAKGEPAPLLASMAEDIVTYDLPPPLASVGPDAKALDRWLATWEGGVTVELRDPTVLIDGNLAVVFGLSRMRGTKRGEGDLDMWSRRTVVLSRRADGWKIVHEHSSVPMMMDGSGKAAVDLTPQE